MATRSGHGRPGEIADAVRRKSRGIRPGQSPGDAGSPPQLFRTTVINSRVPGGRPSFLLQSRGPVEDHLEWRRACAVGWRDEQKPFAVRREIPTKSLRRGEQPPRRPGLKSLARIDVHGHEFGVRHVHQLPAVGAPPRVACRRRPLRHKPFGPSCARVSIRQERPDEHYCLVRFLCRVGEPSAVGRDPGSSLIDVGGEQRVRFRGARGSSGIG